MGRLQVAALLLAAVALVSADFTLGTFDFMVDPGRIFGWRQQWMASQIQLSKSNQGAAGVDVTFFISASSGIANGVFEVTFPTGFDLRNVAGSGISVSGQVVQMLQSFPANTDLQITVPGVLNPTTPGPYGPFALRTRLAPNGQTLDANLAFGSVYITATEGAITSFTVAFAAGANPVINSMGNTLLFSFSLAKGMWARDVFKITLASQFTLADNPLCRSNDIPDKVNNYNGTLADVHQLSCAVTAKTQGKSQVLWIYGLNSNADAYLSADNKGVQLAVSGFTNPDQDYPENAYSWTVETLRFNTHNVLESGTTTGPVTDPGKITTIAWVPTWGRTTAIILRGQTLYMDMTITFTDALNVAGGSVSITSTGTFGSWGGTNCYVVSNSPVTSGCSVVGQVTTISGLGVVPTGGTLTIRHLVAFGDAATGQSVGSITTKSSVGNTVDIGASLASFTLPAATTSNTFTVDVQLQLRDGIVSNTAGYPVTGPQYLKFGLKGTKGLIAATTSMTISCPFTGTGTSATQGPDDFQFALKNEWSGAYKTNGIGDYDSNFSSGITTFGASDLAYTSGSMKVGASGATAYKPGTITFKSTTTIADASQLVIGFTDIYIPLIADNPATAYECAVDLSTSSASLASGIAKFSIVTKNFVNKAFTYFCASGNINGAPVRVSFLPEGVNLLTDGTGVKTYYIEIGMPTSAYGNTFYGSGVTSGGTYPMDSNLSGNPSMTVTTSGSTIVHRVKDLGLITTTSTTVEIYFPVGKTVATSTDTISIKSFYTLSSDLRLNYVTHSGTVGMYAYDTSALSNGGDFFKSDSPAASDSIQNGDRLTTTPTIDFTLTTTQTITADSYFYVVLPKGYSFSSFKDVLAKIGSNAQLSFTWKKYFSSPTLSFAFPGVLVKTLASGTRISGLTDTVVSLRGLNLPLGSGTGTATFVHSAITGDLAASCFNKYDGTITLTKGKVKTITVSPQILYGRGPGSVAITHTIIAVLPHGIDLGGSIKFTLATEWSSTIYTKCSISGLSDISNTRQASCVYTENSFTISNFADFSSSFSTKIIILITNLLTPVNIGSVDVSRQLFAAAGPLTSYTSTGLVIDTFDLSDNLINGLTRVTVRPQLNTGKTNYQGVYVYPENINVGTVNMYVKVTFPYNLPIGSTISIITPYAVVSTISSLTDRCHVALLKYITCSAQSNGFAVTLGDNYNANSALEIFIHQVLTAPTTQPVDPVGYKIVATWSGVTIIDDGNTLSNSQIITPRKAVTGTIAFGGAGKAIDFYPKNAYESATYNFNLTSSVAFNTTHSLIILWPMEFDPYLGVAEEKYNSEIGNYYISCRCPQLSVAYCRVDNWMVIINGITNVVAGGQMDITIFGVRNPPTGTTGAFTVWHVDKDLQPIALNSALGTVTTTTLPGELDIRLVDASVRRIFSTADYTFKFYISDSMDSTTEFRLSFPPEISLSMLASQTSFSCATKWQDQSGSEADVDQDWNTNTACQVNKDTNEVILGGASTTSKTFTTAQQITVNVTGVPTPQWGLVRTPLSSAWDFDDSDYNVWTIYSWWTNQFKIFVYHSDTTKKVITSRPYALQNAAYLGFLQPLRSFSVNNFDPQRRTNRIIVYPGTQSVDIPITTANSSWPLEAKTVAFTATLNGNTPDNGGFLFSSFKHRWIMLQDEWRINFRVAAAATMNKGLYYINWAIAETKQPQVTEGWYTPPPNTLIEVPAYKPQVYAFNIDSINAIPVGNSSLPVRVWVNNAPHADVTVTLEVPEPFNNTVTVSPTTLEFVPDLNSQYFTITVAEEHDFEHLPLAKITLKLSGTNAAQYSISPFVTAPIIKVYYPTKGTIADISVKSITRTSFTIAPSTDQTGIVYYAVSPRGAHISTFAELKALMPNFHYTTDQLAVEGDTNEDIRNGAKDQTDPPEGTSWNVFNHRLFSTHMTTYFHYGAMVMRTTKATPVTIAGLWADSVYQIVAYLDNLQLDGDVEQEQYLKYVWTLPTADFQPLLLNFSQSVPAAQGDSIKNILAKHLGVNPSRLQNQVVTTIYTTTRRVLQSTTNETEPTPPPPPVNNVLGTSFQYDLVANRSLHEPTPTYASTLSNERLNDLTKELFSSLGATLVIYSLSPIPARTPPAWVRPAQVQSYTNTSVTMQYQTSISGQVCCSALPDSSELVIPDHVIEGYSFNWTQVPKQCEPSVVNTLGTLTFPNLMPDEIYYIHCVATDNVSLWPSVMSYTTAKSVPFVTYHSPLTNDMEILPAAGTSLSMAILLWLGLLY